MSQREHPRFVPEVVGIYDLREAQSAPRYPTAPPTQMNGAGSAVCNSALSAFRDRMREVAVFQPSVERKALIEPDVTYGAGTVTHIAAVGKPPRRCMNIASLSP